MSTAADEQPIFPNNGDGPGGLELVPGAEDTKPQTRKRPSGHARKKLAEAKAAAAAVAKIPGAGKTEGSVEKKPAVGKAKSVKRSSGADLFAGLYGGIGTAIGRTGDPRLVPMARVIDYQRNIAGPVFDELVADTALDKIAVQPLVRNADKWKTARDVAGLPLLVLLLTNKPELFPMLQGLAEEMLMGNIVAMGPVITAKRKRDAEAQAVLDDLVAEGMMAPKGDGSAPTPGDLFEMFFAQMAPDTAPVDDTTPAG